MEGVKAYPSCIQVKAPRASSWQALYEHLGVWYLAQGYLANVVFIHHGLAFWQGFIF